MIGSGNQSKIRHDRGILIEYTTASRPLAFAFELNPSSITRTRRVQRRPNELQRTQGDTAVRSPKEAQRAAQGVNPERETLSFTIMLDATDRMNQGDPIASRLGVQPEIDTLRSMLEPKNHVPAGSARLAAAGAAPSSASASQRYLSMLKFQWGPHVLPVFMTQVQVEAKEHLPNLHPYRAEATISLEIIEGDNRLYQLERKRQQASAANHTASSSLSAVTDLVGT